MQYLGKEKYAINKNTYDKSTADPKWLQEQDIQIAKDLCYPKVVINLLENEPDQYKRQHILHDARCGVYDRK